MSIADHWKATTIKTQANEKCKRKKRIECKIGSHRIIHNSKIANVETQLGCRMNDHIIGALS
jgi:hypothetical protein